MHIRRSTRTTASKRLKPIDNELETYGILSICSGLYQHLQPAFPSSLDVLAENGTDQPTNGIRERRFGISVGTTLRALFAGFLLVCVVFSPGAALADPGAGPASDGAARPAPDRYGIAASQGYGYDTPNNLQYMLVTGVAVFDYGKVWHHSAPDGLRFKVEVSAGSTIAPNDRFMASANVFALYYLKPLSVGSFRPYIEGGVGGIYTDFKEPGQGSWFNFNPQAGLGADFSLGPGLSFFTAIRAHHVSNAGLADENRGINSLIFLLGRYF
jgi:hypothetical protein